MPLKVMVTQRFIENYTQHPADERRLAARQRTQPDFGVARQLSLPLVYDHQTRACLHRFLDGHADDVLLLGHVRADDQYRAGLLQVPDGVGGSGLPKHFPQWRGQLRAQVR